MARTRLEDIFETKGAFALCRYLAIHEGGKLTLRGLAEGAGIRSSQGNIAAKKLAEIGIIRLERVGKAYMVELDRKSPVWQKLVVPVLKIDREARIERDDALDPLRKELSRYAVDLAILYHKGRYTAGLLIYSERNDIRRHEETIRNRASRLIRKSVDIEVIQALKKEAPHDARRHVRPGEYQVIIGPDPFAR